MALVPDIETFVPEMESLRRDLHARPELGFKETRTSALIAERLRELGLEVRQGYGGTGVVGTLHGRKSATGRSVGLRADMDALPIQEVSALPYRSREDGVSHACGHDGHSAMLLGAAMYLARDPDFAGTVHFIFQPAEELLLGAKAMIDDGLFTDHPADSVFSLHNDPKLPIGTVMTKAGSFMAGADHFDLTVQGRSGHAARPEDCADPVVIAAQIVTLSQSIVSRRIRATDPAVLTFARLHSGKAYNVIPETAELAGTFRSLTPGHSDLVEATLGELSASIAASHGATAELDYRRTCPVLENTEAATEIAERAVHDVLAEARVVRPEAPIMGTEDFAHMVRARTGCLLRLGARDGDDPVPGLHNARFDFNDRLLPIGTSLWVRLALRSLAE